MSYILDALKKAERERHALRVPTLGTVHDESEARRRIRWPWIAIGALVVVNLAVVLVLIPRSHEPEVAPTSPAVDIPAPAPVVASGPTAPTTVEAKPDMKSAPEQPAPAPGLVKTPHQPSTPPTGQVKHVPEPPAPTTRRAKVNEPPAPPAAGQGASLQTPSAPDGQGKSVQEVPVPAPRADRARQPVPKRETDRAATTPTVNPPAAAPPLAESPARPSTTGPLVSLRQMPPDFQASVSKLRIDALVYGRGEASGMVFINGRKYVVGDAIASGVTVEDITEDGVVLASQGQRFLLRQ